MCLRSDRGYTLAELMIAILIGTVLIAAASATYVAQNRSYSTQESVSELNTQSKIAQDLIANDVKSAGFGTPDDMNSDIINGFTSLITPVDSSTSSDAVTIVGGFRMIGTLWPAGSSSTIACPATVAMGSTQIRISYSGADGPNMTDKRFLTIDGIEFVEVQSCTLGSNGICTNSITIDRPITQDYPLLDTDGDTYCNTGRPVYLVEDVTFCLDANSALRRIRRSSPASAATCTGINTSDNDVIAANIEDLQFRYDRDTNSDGMPETGFVDAPTVHDSTFDPTIRAIRINILATADKADSDYTAQGNPPSVIENRSHTSTGDDLRRRWWQNIATIRYK